MEADPQDSAVVTPCDGFKERYVGEGLFAPLPAAAIGLSGTSTADPGPIHAATSTDFDLGDNVIVTLGRRISSDVVIFVEADEAALHRCLLESARYDPARDQAD